MPLPPPNDTTVYGGRFCNHFFYNIACSLLAMKNDLQFKYSHEDKMTRLGIPLHSGSKTYDSLTKLNDTNILPLLQGDPFNTNVIVEGYFQFPAYAKFLYDYFRTSAIQSSITKANKFKERYDSNNDVFLHLRLDDVAQYNPGVEYYNAALSRLTFDKGYISSDSKDHPYVKALIQKWNLTLIDADEVETIQFGSTCRHIVLSHGSFSFVIGVLGFFSDVYYPPKKFNVWCGDIYTIPSWICVG